MKRSVRNKIISFIEDEEGQALVEYALLLFIFTMASYYGISLFISAWRKRFNNLKSTRAGFAGIFP